MSLKLTYDKAGDAFAMSRARVDDECGEVWEVYPSAMLEIGEVSGELLCVEILDATEILGDLLEPLKSEEEFAVRYIKGDLSPIKEKRCWKPTRIRKERRVTRNILSGSRVNMPRERLACRRFKTL